MGYPLPNSYSTIFAATLIHPLGERIENKPLTLTEHRLRVTTLSIRPLPPLNTLQAFEAAARNMSFSAAAQELNITQSAASRQIKRLEGFLGKSLFHRNALGIRLTPTGERYYASIQQSLTSISTETREVMKWTGNNQITVACSMGIANHWLVPHLARLQREQPALQIRILIVEDYSELELAAFDVGLYYCLESPPQMHVTPLFQEDVIAVCSPGYLAAHLDQPMACAKDLLQHTLLVVEEHHNDWLTWNDWFSSLNLQYSKPAHLMVANNYSLLMNAAISGQGIALGWKTLLKDQLDSTTLIQAVPQSIPSKGQLCVLQPAYRHLTPEVTCFMQWIKSRI